MFRIILFLLCVGMSSQGFSQGLPYLTNFKPQQYGEHNQNWCLLQDNRGVVFVGNNNGLMDYNGISWNLTSLNPPGRVTSIFQEKGGRILIGGDGEFGQIIEGKAGRLTYQSYLPYLENSKRNIGTIWSIFSIGKTNYFCGAKQIIVLDKGQFKFIEPEKEKSFHKFFQVNHQLIIREEGSGLMVLNNKNLHLIKGSGIFANEKVDLFHPIEKNVYLIGTRNKGLYKMLWNGEYNSACEIIPLPSAASTFFQKNKLYCFVPLEEGKIACGTTGGGIAIINTEGQILEIIDLQKGLNDNTVWSLMKDKEGNLWAALNRGISMVELQFDIRLFNNTVGLDENVNCISSIEGNLFAATTKGIYHSPVGLKEMKFEFLGDESFDCVALTKITTNKGKTMAWGICKNEILSIDPLNATLAPKSICENEDFSAMIQLNELGLVISAGTEKLRILNAANPDRIDYKDLEVPGLGKVKSMCVSNDGKWLFAGENNAGVRLFKIKDLISQEKGIITSIKKEITQENLGEFQLCISSNRIFVASKRGLYYFKEGTKKFEDGQFISAQNLFINNVDQQHIGVFRVYADEQQNLWIYGEMEDHENRLMMKKIVAKALIQKDRRYKLIFDPIPRPMQSQINEFLINKDHALLASNDGVFSIKITEQKPVDNLFSSRITGVSINGDSLIFGGNYFSSDGLKLKDEQSKNYQPKIQYQFNSIDFSFTTNHYSQPGAMVYTTFLEGLDEVWSNWSKNTGRDFTKLPEGKYTFHVKAKDPSGNIGAASQYSFTILTPWYRSFAAYSFYVLLFAGLMYIVVRINTGRLKAMNELLDRTVKSRTKELHKEKLKVELKNREVTDSINYAKIIQQSILPPIASVRKVFKESFIFYRPRDIVSGDFFWFWEPGNSNFLKKKNELPMLAVADCTGHGVPGAFMSMIGMEKLNQAVRELNNPEPSSILSFLNREIKTTLKQHGDQASSHDGMEISLLMIDIEKRKIYFSGANRPCWIFRSDENNTIEVISPTKAGIAGLTLTTQVFPTTEITLNQGDTIYIFTDGLTDQFGGEKGKKITSKGLKNFLSTIYNLSMLDQEKAMEAFLTSWMNNEEQVDDILIMGIRI
jgi:serine phosphatase RsbU (regulator of sigma subunit)